MHKFSLAKAICLIFVGSLVGPEAWSATRTVRFHQVALTHLFVDPHYDEGACEDGAGPCPPATAYRTPSCEIYVSNPSTRDQNVTVTWNYRIRCGENGGTGGAAAAQPCGFSAGAVGTTVGYGATQSVTPLAAGDNTVFSFNYRQLEIDENNGKVAGDVGTKDSDTGNVMDNLSFNNYSAISYDVDGMVQYDCAGTITVTDPNDSLPGFVVASGQIKTFMTSIPARHTTAAQDGSAVACTGCFNDTAIPLGGHCVWLTQPVYTSIRINGGAPF